jgi:hypothetical protein
MPPNCHAQFLILPAYAAAVSSRVQTCIELIASCSRFVTEKSIHQYSVHFRWLPARRTPNFKVSFSAFACVLPHLARLPQPPRQGLDAFVLPFAFLLVPGHFKPLYAMPSLAGWASHNGTTRCSTSARCRGCASGASPSSSPSLLLSATIHNWRSHTRRRTAGLP